MVNFALQSFALGISKMSARMIHSPKMGKSLEKVKIMSVNTVASNRYDGEMACYKQVAVAQSGSGGKFCRVRYRCPVQGATAKP